MEKVRSEQKMAEAIHRHKVLERKHQIQLIEYDYEQFPVDPLSIKINPIFNPPKSLPISKIFYHGLKQLLP